MDINGKKKNKSRIAALFLAALNVFFIIFFIEVSNNRVYAFNGASDSGDSLEAKIIAEELTKQKKEERKSSIANIFNEAKANYDAKDYETAQQLFEEIIRLDPKNKSALHYMDLCKNGAEKEMPETITGSLLKLGKRNYKNKQYSAAAADFENALVSNPNDSEVRVWLVKAREMENLYGKKEVAVEERKTVKTERSVAREEKDSSEQAMLLDVDRGWLPPEKLPREEMQIEEIVSPEELAEQDAKKKLEEKMASVVVPAISITDADVQDLIRQLMEMTGVTIVVDERALSELTKEQAIKISLTTANPMPLLDILNIAFKTTQLGYKVESNYVWVSSKANVSKEDMVTRTYRLKYGVRQTRKIELKELESTPATK
ncbi:MAG: hypothetical protein V1933_04420 [Candidatus Omnitrophota bacterium]